MRPSCASMLFPLVLTACLVLAGCGGAETPPLGQVKGQITMDGDPLEGILVLFKPEEGRAATGITDSDGNYEIEYVYNVKGAKIGPTKVMFEWPLGTKSMKPLSEKYTTKSDIKVDVEKGKNTFDFDLKSDGASIAPPLSAD